MSEFGKISEFPDIEIVKEWSDASKLGLRCGIYGCPAIVSYRCPTCNGGYCEEHKVWHFHSAGNAGVIVKDD